MIDEMVLKRVAEAYQMHRTAREDARECEQHLQVVVGDFITRTHTVDDLVVLLDMVAGYVQEEQPC